MTVSVIYKSKRNIFWILDLWVKTLEDVSLGSGNIWWIFIIYYFVLQFIYQTIDKSEK